MNAIMPDRKKTGHRQRLRDRFIAGEDGSRTEQALLELLLTYSIPRRDVKPLAQELIDKFGSLSGVLSVSHEELIEVKGIKETSVVLLKAVGAIRTDLDEEKRDTEPGFSEQSQQTLFECLAEEVQPEEDSKPYLEEPKVAVRLSSAPVKLPKEKEKEPQHRPTSKRSNRKFQVCNGYLLEFDQLARILHFLAENRAAKRIKRSVLMENTGLSNRQLESLVSVGTAMGLIQLRSQTLTQAAAVIVEHDIFVENKGTLEWCHYVGAGSRRNLIWYEVFNTILPNEKPMTQDQWMEYFRQELAGQYTDGTIGKHLYEEVRFIVDAYLERSFQKLELLQQTSDEKLYCRRYTDFEPLVLCAAIYDYGATNGTQLLQVGEMGSTPGSPAVVFGLDEATFRQLVEGLHDCGWLRYETTHGLNQIRLKPLLSSLEFLRAYYEEREPKEGSSQEQGELLQ